MNFFKAAMPRHKIRIKVLPLLLLSLFPFAPNLSASISIDNFTPATNNRFANNASFIGSGVDFSGVGRTSNATNRKWATLIGPNIFLSATHWHPAIGQTVRFYPDNDPSSVFVERTVTSGVQLNGSDLWIGAFDYALPATIKQYDYATINLSAATFLASSYYKDNVLMSGISPTTTGYGASGYTNQAVGQNQAEGFIDNQSVGGSTGDVIVTVKNQPSDSTYGYTYRTYEAQAASGDSGSPLFSTDSGTPLLLGIAWAIGTTDIDPNPVTTVTRNISIYSYTGQHTGAIEAFYNANVIPEPSSIILFGVAILFGVGRRFGMTSKKCNG
ncbi:MAG: PEP-CTERM sorting domain-containing protein [Chthoniobacterales bacterium]